MSISINKLEGHLKQLRECALCPEMVGPVVVGRPAPSRVMLIGQAPGTNEGDLGRPFAWTAGKTLFKWFDSIGISEEKFRSSVYMAAVCRCFPGKSKSGSGDRVPTPVEISRCSQWLDREFELLQPKLVIPVGKLAILQLLELEKPLNELIGRSFTITRDRRSFDVVPLPHPSGASPWHRMSPGKELLKKALKIISRHEEFRKIS